MYFTFINTVSKCTFIYIIFIFKYKYSHIYLCIVPAFKTLYCGHAEDAV